MSIITRFAPSPTGYLHIGGARTALFNYLYARHHKGKFILRIEDTDKSRSTKEATQAILDGMSWLGLDYDELIYQSHNEKDHVDVAKALVEKGAAYYCYTPQSEIIERREQAQKEKRHFKFVSPWRDKNPSEAPKDQKPVIRIKAPLSGSITINDEVQRKVEVSCTELDDMILLRSDGTPTYMLAVVVDDHNEKISHIIRGDDHLNNAFRQALIYNAMGWQIPTMAHIPLIHGSDGKKLSKRHGALGLDYYQENGYLKEAIFNYLLRLGWSHGDDEIISKEQAIKWFNTASLGKSAARLDFDKMLHVNSHYIKTLGHKEIFEQLNLLSSDVEKIYPAIDVIRSRAKTLNDIRDFLTQVILTNKSLAKDEKAEEIIQHTDKSVISEYVSGLEKIAQWSEEHIKNYTKTFTDERELKLGVIAQFIRAQLTGTASSPSVFEIMPILGKEESLKRLRDY